MARAPRRTARRRNPALLSAMLLLLVFVGIDYALGFASDTVEVVDRSSGIESASLSACGATLPLRHGFFERRHWRVTPPRLCHGPTSLAIRLRDGSVDTCTGFSVHPGTDWRVTVTASGCGGFEPATLPAW